MSGSTHQVKRIGLTGGMGVGKSTVAKFFKELAGIPVLDADQVARELREPGKPGAIAIEKRFGTLDRLKLRKMIAQDPQAKKDLEALLHPLIQVESEKRMKEMAKTHPHAAFLIYEASLLLEAGRKGDFDAIIVVISPLPERIARISARDGASYDQALALIDAQSPDSFRVKQASYIIDNLGNLDDLKTQVRKVLDQIISA